MNTIGLLLQFFCFLQGVPIVDRVFYRVFTFGFAVFGVFSHVFTSKARPFPPNRLPEVPLPRLRPEASASTRLRRRIVVTPMGVNSGDLATGVKKMPPQSWDHRFWKTVFPFTDRFFLGVKKMENPKRGPEVHGSIFPFWVQKNLQNHRFGYVLGGIFDPLPLGEKLRCRPWRVFLLIFGKKLF